MIEFTVQTAEERLDKLVLKYIDNVSRSQVQALIKDGLITVDGEQVKAGVKLRGGETIVVNLPETETETLEAEDIPLTIIYEDEHLAVINKPAGLVTHPGVGNTSGTLVNALLHKYPEVAALDERQGIVHRLDKDTSGVMVVARTPPALEDLMQQFQERTVDKTYVALLERTPKTHNGRIEAAIGRDPKQRKRMAVVRDGKEAITEFNVIDDNFQEGAALVEFNILTGRTHQIRVHAAFIGCPIVGDRIYGFRKQRVKLKRNFLHAARISFDHPITDERLVFEAPLPVGLQEIMRKLRP
jgi:23S rRNA pseudouridine1911/1915/1917 synthase